MSVAPLYRPPRSDTTGHLNPAVSITLVIFRGFPWRRASLLIVAQLLGAFVAGVLALAVYYDSLKFFDPTRDPYISGQALFTLPPKHVSDV